MTGTPRPRPPGTVYGATGGRRLFSQRDWLVTGSLAFLAVAVLVGGIFAAQGLRSGSPAGEPRPGSGADRPRSDAARSTGSTVPSPSTRPDGLPTGSIRLRAKHAGLCLAIPPRDNPDGIPATLAQCADSPAQRWRLDEAAAGVYLLVSDGGACLDVTGGADNDGAPAQQWSCHGGDNQRWRLERGGDGSVTVASAKSGKCLDVYGANTQPGATIVQWSCHGQDNQRWFLDA